VKGPRLRVPMVAAWATALVLSFAAGLPAMAVSPFADVTVQQAQALIQQRAGQKDFVVLDVRTPQEFAGGHLAGALNINFLASDFAAHANALDRGKTYLVYCHSGNRSVRAVQAMVQLRFRSVYNMLGGIIAWESKDFPLSRTP